MKTVTMHKRGANITLAWAVESPGMAPGFGGRAVFPWEEIEGVVAEEWPDGDHAISAVHMEAPEPMESTLFLKEHGRMMLLWDELEHRTGAINDVGRRVDPEEVLDGRRAADWPDGTHLVSSTYRRKA